MARLWIAISLLLASAACASSPAGSEPGPGSIVLTNTFTFLVPHIADASVLAAKGIADPARPNQISVVVATAPSFCAAASSARPGVKLANLFELVVVLGHGDAASEVAPGTYTLGDALAASYDIDDSACNTTSAGSATAGSVFVSSVAPTFSGNFDLTFPAGRVIGDFNAEYCAGPPGTTGDRGGNDGGGVSCLSGGTAPF